MGGVLGLQLSVKRTGICLIPADWDHTSASLVLKSKETEREGVACGKPHALAKLETERYLKVADWIVKGVKRSGVEDVVTSEYGFSKDGVTKYILSRAELTGVVKSQLLLACKVSLASLTVSTARSFVVGGLSRGDQKKQVSDFMKGHGFRFENFDEMGAFVVAYYWYCLANDIGNRFLPQQRLF